MKILAAFFLFCLSCFGYSWRGQVDLGAASSGTLTNITLATVSVSDAHLKTVANGGTINDATCTHTISNVPCDLIVTDDPACGPGSTAFKWGYETYDGSAGTARLWILAPVLGTTHLIPYVCTDDTGAHSYPGGSPGDEFDSSTASVFHFPDGNTLSAVDFKGSNSGAISGATAATGEIDGGAQFSGPPTKITVPGIATAANYTISGWIKPLTGLGTQYILGGASGGASIFMLNSGQVQFGREFTIAYTGSTTNLASGVWQYLVITVSSTGAYHYYINGVAAGSFTGGPTAGINTASALGYSPAHNGGNNGILDEWKFAAIVRPPEWVATEAANQLSPPAITDWTSVTAPGSFVPANIY